MHYLKSFSLILILLLSSCSLEKRLKRKYNRAERKIEKLTLLYPELLQKDTLYDTISLIVPKIESETSFVSLPNDTVILEKERLRIQYIIRNDSVFLSGQCDTDTIYYPIEIPYEKIVVVEENFVDKFKKFVKTSWWLLVLIFILLVILRIGLKFINPFK